LTSHEHISSVMGHEQRLSNRLTTITGWTVVQALC